MASRNMRNSFFKYEQLLRNRPRIWHPGFIIHKIIQNEVMEFSRLITSENSGSVLDFGCGKSPFRNYFEQYQGADVDRLNKDPDFLIDKESNRINNLANQSVDNIISIEVIEHVPNIQLFIHEASRILKPSGYFLIVAPFVYNYHGSDDYCRYSKNYFLNNGLFKDFDIVRINSTPNDFIEFLTFNMSHFIGIFPIIRFFYPVFFLINISGIALSKIFKLFFLMAGLVSPKFTHLYKNSFLLFPLQISVTLRKK